MVDVGDTISVWVGQDDVELVEQYDAYYKLRDDGPYSRGEYIREGMELQLAVDEALDEAGIDISNPRDKRAYIKQLIFDDARD